MEFQDKTIECKDCHAGFTLTAGEQDFFTQKGLNMPGRCKPCRAQRKAERDGQRTRPRTRAPRWWSPRPRVRVAGTAVDRGLTAAVGAGVATTTTTSTSV